MHMRGLELAMKAPDNESCAFTWKEVILNLPGMADYNPAMP